jgi:hemerythrin-like metal-binding protein
MGRLVEQINHDQKNYSINNSTAKPVLLVIDDEPDIADVVQYVAESIGYEVQPAQNFELFQKNWFEHTPAAIVMDIVMPNCDGHEMLEWLIEQKCTAPILLISGHGERYLGSAESLGRMRGAPIFGTLGKPFTIAEIKTILLQILETSTQWNEEMSVGVDALDIDHQGIFWILRDLRIKIDADGSAVDIGNTLIALQDYTDYHFRREELLMEEYEYPERVYHASVHRAFAQKIREILINMANDAECYSPRDLYLFVSKWLKDHILGMDQGYEQWIKTHPVVDIKNSRRTEQESTIAKTTQPGGHSDISRSIPSLDPSCGSM